jgi:hemoglobin-like flavoprotein
MPLDVEAEPEHYPEVAQVLIGSMADIAGAATEHLADAA